MLWSMGREKLSFRALADWIEQWYQSPAFTLSRQTACTLTTILCVHTMLIDDLLSGTYVITARLQIDPVDRHFSQYRRMSGGRLLVNSREVLISERILWCCSFIKENINFWEVDLTSENQECVTVIKGIFGNRSQEIVESVPDENCKSDHWVCR